MHVSQHCEAVLYNGGHVGVFLLHTLRLPLKRAGGDAHF